MAPEYKQHAFVAAANIGHDEAPFDYYMSHSISKMEACGVFGGWKRKGGQTIFSIDDNILEVPSWSSVVIDDEHRNLWYLYRDFHDVILTSTPALAEAVNRPAKTLMARNLIQVDEYRVKEATPREKGPLRVFWSGSSTHYGDLQVIDDALCTLMNKYGPEKLDFIFLGDAPRNFIRDFVDKGLTFQQGFYSSVYAPSVGNIKPHIVLAPLADHIFNYSKSNIRVLEGWSIGGAVVSSNVGEYKVVQDGVDGLIASKPEDWVTQISRLVEDEELRINIARNGRARVSKEFDWCNPLCRNEWRNVINTLEKWL